MEAFFTARNRWPVGWTRLHVYLCPDLSTDRALADLITRTHTVLTGIPWLAPVPADWLHLTIQQISPEAAQITPAQRQQLLDALRAHLTPVAPFRVTVGSVLAGASGVVADVDGDQPGQPLHDLHARTRTAISSVLSPAAIDRNAMPPHLGLGYGLGPGSSGHLQSALRRAVRPPHATMTIDRVHLVDVTQGTTGYTWTTVGQVPLKNPCFTGVSGQRECHCERLRAALACTVSGCERGPAGVAASPVNDLRGARPTST